MASPLTSPDASPSPIATADAQPKWLHNLALGIAVLGPAAMIVPPRRFDLRFVVLSAGTFWSLNKLSSDWTGMSAMERTTRRWNKFSGVMDKMAGGKLPEKALRNQELMQAEREKREALLSPSEREALAQKKEQAKRSAWGLAWAKGGSEADQKATGEKLEARAEERAEVIQESLLEAKDEALEIAKDVKAKTKAVVEPVAKAVGLDKNSRSS